MRTPVSTLLTPCCAIFTSLYLAFINARIRLGVVPAIIIAASFSSQALTQDGTDRKQLVLPNIVIILADDLGWRDVGYHGSEIKTPNIDRIAHEGVELDRFYAQPMCSPARAALMTGKSPLRLGIHKALGKNEKSGLPLDEKILPQYLARLGYQSLMVGKWHLGNYTTDMFPQARGFEHFYGYVSGGIGYWDHNHGGGHDWQRNGVTLREDGYATHLLANEAAQLLENRDRSRPTFLYLAFGAPHLPSEAPPEAIARFDHIRDPVRRVHAAMVSELDSAIGRVLAAMESEGMLENTLLLLSSDNGGLVRSGLPSSLVTLSNITTAVFDRPIPVAGLEFVVSNVEDAGSDNSPLPKGKMSVAEGGARVPAAIWWPGRLEGGRFEGFMSISDVLPTILEAIGEASMIPTFLDGASQWAALTGTGTSETPDYMITGFEGVALYRPPWKLIPSKEPRLFHIYSDPLETDDLAEKRPEIVRSMLERIDEWPTKEHNGTSVFDLLLDPDSFGGAEDREPWADVARARSHQSIPR